MTSRHPRPSRPRSYARRVGLVVAAIVLLVATARALAPSISNASFDFLLEATNWDIGYAILPYTARDPYWWAFIVGLSNTIVAGSISILGATTLGFAVGVARASGNHLLSDIGKIYVDVIRNIPLILQAMFWYAVVLHLPPARSSYVLLDVAYLSNRGLYIPKLANTPVVFSGLILLAALIWGTRSFLRSRQAAQQEMGSRWRLMATGAVTIAALLALLAIAPSFPDALAIDFPKLTGLNFRGGAKIPPEFAALIAAITIYRGAFISEVFRGGFASVSKGHTDAARSLGLRPWAILLKIRVPLALISIIPPLSSELIIIMKVTSIGIVVGFWDLFAVSSQSANLTGRPLEVLFLMMLIYLVLNYSMVGVMNAANRRVRVPGLGTNA
jgi:general L-amino acid transport system permease protein